MPEVMGSPATTAVCTRPHFWHSNVRVSMPDGLVSSFDSSMRRWWQFGQPGRLMAETSAEDIGLNSGMTYDVDLGMLANSDRTANAANSQTQ